MIKVISSKDNVIVKNATKLKDVKYRKSSKTFLVEGKKTVEEALKYDLLLKVFTLKELDLPFNIEQLVVPMEIIKKISNTVNPEGVVGVAKYPTYNESNYQKCLYLDAINDPGNMGTIIRSAVALGYEAIYVSNDSVDIFNEKVISASKGAVFALPIFNKKYNEIAQKYQTICSYLGKDSVNLEDVKPKKPFLLVLGNEAHGIRKDIIDNCDLKIKIPMANFESLNVAVAAGILMYFLNK